MNKLNINYKLVDTAGQITAVVLSVIKREKQSLVSKKLMKNLKIEQVVFIENNKIQTMGNELCINGSLAGAYLLNDSTIEISGLNKPIQFVKENEIISARFPLNLLQNKTKNIIQLAGIVYIISNNKKLANKRFLNKLANEYSVPASGMIFYERNKIKPLVYVKDTNSLVWENACGSGSLSYFLYSGIDKIIQPSGKTISIKKNKNYYIIKSPVEII